MNQIKSTYEELFLLPWDIVPRVRREEGRFIICSVARILAFFTVLTVFIIRLVLCLYEEKDRSCYNFAFLIGSFFFCKY
jgi:hypothetical protein